ncbi:MAG: diacylglycerol kinase [Phycisphaerales bacterium]|nr:diacylglycerol kinase [Phycisphaerales bacterium]
MAAAAVAIAIGAVLSLSRIEWIILIGTILLVLSLEAMNCAVERVVDLASPDYHELAKQAKDLAAGAVLIASIGSVVIGAMLFVPKIIALWRP